MRILEARFAIDKRRRKRYVVIGRVYCSGRRALISPTTGACEAVHMDIALCSMVEKLCYLLRNSGANPFDGLRSLRSDFWTFVEVQRGMVRS